MDVLVFEILDHNLAPLVGNRRCHGNRFVLHVLWSS